jgi:hypothetical protein
MEINTRSTDTVNERKLSAGNKRRKTEEEKYMMYISPLNASLIQFTGSALYL